MTKTTTAPKSATAGDVRNYFNGDAKRLSALSPEARKTVEALPGGKMPRGRLHKEAVALHNKRRKVQYATGNTNAARTKAKADAVALREQAREAGFAVADKGRVPKAAVAALTKG